MHGRFIARLYFGQRERGQFFDRFLHREVKRAPAPGELLDNQVGEHDHEGVATKLVPLTHSHSSPSQSFPQGESSL